MSSVRNEIIEIAKRVRELREICGYTAEDLSRELGIDTENYMSYEADGSFPISVIYEIANKFKVDFNELVIGDSSHITTFQIIKAGEGKVTSRYEGYHFNDLAFRFKDKVMQPLLVTLDPSDKCAAPVSHSGQEFNIVLEGKMYITLGDKDYLLEKGDSIYFNPEIMHSQSCVGNEKTVFLTVITE